MKNKIYIFNKSLKWIKENTINNNGICVTSKQQIIYPEVTGYYIPSLLTWGERELAISYAKYLCSIQREDGSWYDSTDTAPYIFDSAQILKGLISIHEILPEVDNHIMLGCDWILSNMQENGRLITPCKDAWGDDEEFCSELIHIYCLTPIRDAGKIFDKPDYIKAVNKILAYYKNDKIDKIKNFSLLSHFYAYVLEGLFDLGEVELVRECMGNLTHYQNARGGIKGLKNVSWVCSTGLFQLALVWYKLGELESGNRIFDYACSLQNETGGWYGSYASSKLEKIFCRGKIKPTYFPEEEISWASKYFLDALTYKGKLEFEKQAPIFINEISENDGRYVLIKDLIKKSSMSDIPLKICDMGCGKGRYLKNLVKTFPDNEYYAVDLSANVMKDINFVYEKKVGRLTQIPYADNLFDLVYVCEALEHAINIQGAVKELFRVVKKGGKLIIIDKPIEKLGQLNIDDWEQWIDDKMMIQLTSQLGGVLEIVKSVAYENKDDGLFRAWIISKLSDIK